MLEKFRQISPLFKRTLLGMLLLVWVSLALSPCVIASELMPDDSSLNASMHEKMADCAYCPTLEAAPDTNILCQQKHDFSTESTLLTLDSIDTESYVLYELPVATLNTQILLSNTLAFYQPPADIITLPPLTLTGILRI